VKVQIRRYLFAAAVMFAIEAADCSFANVSQHTAVGLTLTKSMDEEDSI
jgi:hypothetical protein